MTLLINAFRVTVILSFRTEREQRWLFLIAVP
jgi:hypothetical protein